MTYREHLWVLRTYWEEMKSINKDFQFRYQFIQYVSHYGEKLCVNQS